VCGGGPSKQILDLAPRLRTIANYYFDAERSHYIDDCAELRTGLAPLQGRYRSLAQIGLGSKLSLAQTGATAVAPDGRAKLL
jgi:hypothetical protein